MTVKSNYMLPFLNSYQRTFVKIMLDSVIAFFAFGAAVVLQKGNLYIDLLPLVGEMLVFSLFCAVIFTVFKTHRAIWSYVSLADLHRLSWASITAILLYFGVREFLYEEVGLDHILFSQPVITGMLLLGGLCSFRVLYRKIHFGHLKDPKTANVTKTRVLIIGAEDSAELFIRSIKHNPNSAYRILGILDPRADRQGRTIHGVKVLGKPEDLGQVVENLDEKPQRLIFTTTEDTKKVPLDVLIAEADRLGMRFSRLPSLTEFRDGDTAAHNLKPIAIEDLLGRPQAAPNMETIKDFVVGKKILVTGAGGSIGSELTRQIASFGPSEMTIIDHSEYNLYAIDLDIRRDYGLIPMQTILADIRNQDKVNAIFKEQKPDIVFHAAALKHVPLVEMNPAEGILTNVVGTRNVAEAALKCKAQAFVQISTDKAVNPTNIMGASKRIGEYYAQALDLEKSQTRFITVRFGNVLGSSGSVVPLFKQQLERGGPLTVTHADIKRYFMTIKEAVGLVLQASACAIAQGDEERGRILVLDMKEPIKIIDVARQMIRLADLTPDEDIEIKITGLRPGEKLYEELFDDAEKRLETNIPSTFAANPKPLSKAKIKKAMTALMKLAENNDIDGIVKQISEIVPGFSHETHK
ncbi:MAG: nucleotide sugar dehydratase [Alphaproteobacteria bacterium]|nr:MAG: nucleotide sugar dehydratase [Alphaproteobacteria bacterium]